MPIPRPALYGLGGLAVGGAVWYYTRKPASQPKSAAPATPPEPIFVINGFYMSMRDKFTKPPAQIHYFTTEWDPATVTWAQFRGEVLGATDPATAVEGSLRRTILDKWQELGLKSQPTVGDNGVHASASPFEALAERLNWVAADVKTDGFAQAMVAAGIPEATILDWTKDPQVLVEGKKGSLFDALEDLDSPACLEKSVAIAAAPGPVPEYAKNEAFVFIKPHAVQPQVVELVKAGLAAKGVKILTEGTLDAQTISDKKLIDNHYYAIANKASLTKPDQLNPPEAKKAEFQQKFGVAWEDALKQGKVFNALDACTHLGIDGDQLDRIWAKAKDAGLLVKFGGGFYAGKVQP